jgi:adenine phosphoribosyltransferase
MQIVDALSLIREIPDYPKPGVRFQDITPLLANGDAFSTITRKFASYATVGTLVAGIEARIERRLYSNPKSWKTSSPNDFTKLRS